MHEISVHMKAAQENGYSNPNEAENIKIFQPSRCHHKGAVSGGRGGGGGGGGGGVGSGGLNVLR